MMNTKKIIERRGHVIAAMADWDETQWRWITPHEINERVQHLTGNAIDGQSLEDDLRRLDECGLVEARTHEQTGPLFRIALPFADVIGAAGQALAETTVSTEVPLTLAVSLFPVIVAPAEIAAEIEAIDADIASHERQIGKPKAKRREAVSALKREPMALLKPSRRVEADGVVRWICAETGAVLGRHDALPVPSVPETVKNTGNAPEFTAVEIGGMRETSAEETRHGGVEVQDVDVTFASGIQADDVAVAQTGIHSAPDEATASPSLSAPTSSMDEPALHERIFFFLAKNPASTRGAIEKGVPGAKVDGAFDRAMKHLLGTGQVAKAGEKRGTRYTAVAKDALPLNFTDGEARPIEEAPPVVKALVSAVDISRSDPKSTAAREELIGMAAANPLPTTCLATATGGDVVADSSPFDGCCDGPDFEP